jgi:xylan 1,4-beta-xylosidase
MDQRTIHEQAGLTANRARQCAIPGIILATSCVFCACSEGGGTIRHTTGQAGTVGQGGSVDVAGQGGAAGSAGSGIARLNCPDSSAWTPSADPGSCADTAPYTTGGTPGVALTVDAAALGPSWNRFYEKAVASDHANTLLCTAYGRNIQNALRKGHAQAGFEYVRFHGILDDDIGVYSEDPSGTPIYDFTRFDQVYDTIVSAGMRPIVELSFTPSALASDPSGTQPKLWYNKVYPNISRPKDWNRWQDFMAEIVSHLEQRYGADEVRNHWYFEVWNEPSWMYSEGDGGYIKLYENTVLGLLRADPLVKVGGPAGSSGESPTLVANLIDYAAAHGLKLDFITYHRYGGDGGTQADANGMQTFHQRMVGVLNGHGFTGELMNDEFGATSTPDVLRDTEASASFIAKTIHLIGTDPDYAPPGTYAHWTISDLYEEINTGTSPVYREGNYGLLLKGDPHYPESFDVAKPAFNAFRLLHRLGDTRVSVSGGTTADGVNAVATLTADQSALQVLVYHHVAGSSADSSASTLVSLTVNHLPFASGSVRVRHFVVDRTHANSYQAWVGMGRPKTPTQDQWVALRDAAELCYYETTTTLTGGSLALTFPQYVQSVSLLEVTGG